MGTVTLNAKTFSEVVAKNSLVVIDFWATWCEPCKSFSKVIEATSEKFPEVVFATVDIDKEKELAADFNISSVPTVMLIKDQVVVYADSGSIPPSALAELIEKAKVLDVSEQQQ